MSRRQPYPHARGNRNHRRSSTPMTRASAVASTSAPTITCRPFASMICMRPFGVSAQAIVLQFRGFVGFALRSRYRTLVTDNHNRRKTHTVVRKRTRSRHPPPGKQLAGRQSVTTRRGRYQPRTAEALGHDPKLLFHRPTPPRPRRYHFELGDLRHRRMNSHTPMSSRSSDKPQGGLHRMRTADMSSGTLKVIGPPLTKPAALHLVCHIGSTKNRLTSLSRLPPTRWSPLGGPA